MVNLNDARCWQPGVVSLVKHGLICSGANVIITNGLEGNFTSGGSEMFALLHVSLLIACVRICLCSMLLCNYCQNFINQANPGTVSKKHL